MNLRSLLPALAFVAACGTTTRFVATNPSPHPLTARPAESVAVFTTGRPNLPYVEIGIIQGRQASEVSFDDMPRIIAAMRRDAGRAGCDGLIINGSSDKAVGSHHGTTTLEGFWGACIVYLPTEAADDSTSPPATAAWR